MSGIEMLRLPMMSGRDIVLAISIAFALIGASLSARKIARLRGRTDLEGRRERTETWAWLCFALYVPLAFGMPALIGLDLAVAIATVFVVIGFAFLARARWMK